MKGLGGEKKRLQHNIVDFFPDIPNVPDRWSLHGEWTHRHTYTHNTNKSMIGQHVEALYKCRLAFINLWEFYFFIDFNAGMEHVALENFCNLYSLASLVNKPACWKNSSKPSYIDLNLTNWPKYLQNTNITEAGLSDFHKTAFTLMKTTFRKLKPKIMVQKIQTFFQRYFQRHSLRRVITSSN